MEIVLDALGARQSAGFKQFIDAVTAPFLAPFHGLVLEPGIGRFRLMTSYVIALAVYMLLHMAVNGLLGLFVHRKTAVKSPSDASDEGSDEQPLAVKRRELARENADRAAVAI